MLVTSIFTLFSKGVFFMVVNSWHCTLNGKTSRSKLKSNADDKINVSEKLKFHFGEDENVVVKG